MRENLMHAKDTCFTAVCEMSIVHKVLILSDMHAFLMIYTRLKNTAYYFLIALPLIMCHGQSVSLLINLQIADVFLLVLQCVLNYCNKMTLCYNISVKQARGFFCINLILKKLVHSAKTKETLNALQMPVLRKETAAGRNNRLSDIHQVHYY